MRQHFILPIMFTILVGYSSATMAQGTWQWRNPLPQGNALQGIHFLDENTGWLVGCLGAILKTTNGGITWVEQASGTTNDLGSVHFENANVGYAGGQNATMLKTTNGGETWQALATGFSPTGTFLGLQFTDENVGWTGGSHYVLRTTDGGSSWQNFSQPEVYWINDVFGPSEQICFWAGFGGIQRTTNGGQSWSYLWPPSAYQYFHLSFLNESVGWAVASEGAVAMTTDGGETWTPKGSLSGAYKYGICFRDPLTGWGYAYDGALFRTNNAGTSWSKLSLTGIRDVYFPSSTGYAVGSGGRIYKSSDDGITWAPAYTTVKEGLTLQDLCFLDRLTGIAVGDSGKIFKTTDGGATWPSRVSPSAGALNAVYFIDNTTGWVAGQDKILKSTDGGEHWSTKYLGSYEDFRGVHFVNAKNGWAVGDKLLKSTNGGQTWESQRLPDVTGSYYLNSVFFLDTLRGWVVGSYGEAYSTVNGGATWTKVTMPTSSSFFDINFVTADTGWIAGSNGVVLGTVDGGGQWDILSTGTTKTLSHIDPLSGQDVWIVGEGSGYDLRCIVVHSTDGGSSWTIVQIPNNNSLCASAFTDVNTGLVVGADMTVLQYQDSIAIPSSPADFVVTAEGPAASLSWSDLAENEQGFHIYRRDYGTSFFKKIGTVGAGVNTYTDLNLTVPATYYYRIAAFNASGQSAHSSVIGVMTSPAVGIEEPGEAVTSFALRQNFPNPFNPETEIGFDVPVLCAMTLIVYDAAGREVRALVNGVQAAGHHSVRWNGMDRSGRPVASGAYFVRMRAGEYTMTKAMMLMH